MLEFYPIVLTRTALRDFEKNRDGFDFYLRVCPPDFPDNLETVVEQIINEDYYPVMTVPRRVYYRNSKYIFWGLGLYNQWFLPSETINTLDLSSGEKRLRGFWGGMINIAGMDPSRVKNEILPLVAGSLCETVESCVLTEHLAVLSKSQPRVDMQESFGNYPMMEYVGQSSFCFAARLFQHFVQKDWFNPRCPVTPSERFDRNTQNPVISNIPYDLQLFVPMNFLASIENDQRQDSCEGLVTGYRNNDLEAINKFWTRAITADKDICLVAPLSTEHQACRIKEAIPLQETVLLSKETQPRIYVIPERSAFALGTSENSGSIKQQSKPIEYPKSKPIKPGRNEVIEDDKLPCCARCKLQIFINYLSNIFGIDKLKKHWNHCFHCHNGTKSHEDNDISKTICEDFDPYTDRINSTKQDSDKKNNMFEA